MPAVALSTEALHERPVTQRLAMLQKSSQSASTSQAWPSRCSCRLRVGWRAAAAVDVGLAAVLDVVVRRGRHRTSSRRRCTWWRRRRRASCSLGRADTSSGWLDRRSRCPSRRRSSGRRRHRGGLHFFATRSQSDVVAVGIGGAALPRLAFLAPWKPPQSTSVSSPFLVLSVGEGTWQMFPVQTALWQSLAARHSCRRGRRAKRSHRSRRRSRRRCAVPSDGVTVRHVPSRQRPLAQSAAPSQSLRPRCMAS